MRPNADRTAKKKNSTMIHDDIDWADLSRNIVDHHVKKSASTGLEYTENAATADIA
jgi:predicted ATPase